MVRAIAHDTIKNNVNYAHPYMVPAIVHCTYNASLYGSCYCPCAILRLCTWLLGSILFTAHPTRNG